MMVKNKGRRSKLVDDVWIAPNETKFVSDKFDVRLLPTGMEALNVKIEEKAKKEKKYGSKRNLVRTRRVS